MTFQIQNENGTWVDITPYIALEGLKYSRNDVDAPNAGRTQDGTMVRDRVATKIRWDVTCTPLTSDKLSLILTLIQPEIFNLKYLDPMTNTVKIGSFYSNNVPAQFKLHRANGEEVWAGLTFPVVEQ
jgi:hypothetical protein